jgi:hypothetical protein
MFYNIPITAPAPRATKSSTSTTAKGRQVKSYGRWNFLTHKEAREFLWTKTFAYPENHYTITPMSDGTYDIAEFPRTKDEKPQPFY